MNKKVLIIIISAAILLAVIGTGVYFFVIKPQATAAAKAIDGNVAGQSRQGNFANFKNISGKVLSITSTDLIVDSGSAQSDVIWDSNTRLTGNVLSDQATILAVGNTVSINFTAVNGVNQATKVSKIDLAAFGPSQTPGQNAQGNGSANGGSRRGNGGNGGTDGNGVVRPTTRTSYTGTVTAVNGNTLTITVNQFGGFGRGQTGSSGTPSPTPASMDFDISTAKFFSVVTKTINDIKQGDTVQISGTLQTNQQVIARNIVIE